MSEYKKLLSFLLFLPYLISAQYADSGSLDESSNNNNANSKDSSDGGQSSLVGAVSVITEVTSNAVGMETKVTSGTVNRETEVASNAKSVGTKVDSDAKTEASNMFAVPPSATVVTTDAQGYTTTQYLW